MSRAVLVSGGVDSSVALAQLARQGYHVTAFYLKIWLEDELAHLGSCPWQEDLSYVKAVCANLQVPLEVISFQREYHEEVVTRTIEYVKQGYTPNPDILCNSYIKFGAFLKHIGNDFNYVATGHYARMEHTDGAARLFRSPDVIKDQTYFLAHLQQKQLQKIIFPLASYTKTQVRELANMFDLPNKDRKDSQGICFLGNIKFAEFLRAHLGEQRGLLVEWETGQHVGEHHGFWFYTQGQRQGIGLPGGPWYVVTKHSQSNTVFISRNYYAGTQPRNRFEVRSCNWFSPHQPQESELLVKLRHGAHMYEANITYHTPHHLTVQLKGDDQGIAPGQSAVFYRDNECLGGGIIEVPSPDVYGVTCHVPQVYEGKE